MNNLLMTLMGGAKLLVNWIDTTVNNAEFSGTVFAGVRIDSDGGVYESDSSGNFSTATYQWLDSGVAEDVWVERTVTTAPSAWQTDTIGSSRVQLNTDQILRVSRASTGTETAEVTVSFYNAPSGGALLASGPITLVAERLV